MTTSARVSTQPLVRTMPTAASLVLPRPDLPPWFRGATTSLYAACGGLAVALAALALTATLGPTAVGVAALGTFVFAALQTALTLGIGAWCHTIARSRRADPTTPQLNPEWFLAAWFIPVVNLIVPPQMFGDLWASAKWQQSDRRGSNTPLAPRPWIISMWALAWGLDFAWVVLTWFFRDIDATFFVVHLGLSAVALALLGGIVRVIARELDGRPSTGTRVIP